MDLLFSKGIGANTYPVKSVYLETGETMDYPAQVMFVVPKRNFKKAPDRNKLKRRMKEVYRLNKHKLYDHLLAADKKIILAFIYTGKKTEDYKKIETSVTKLMSGVLK